MKRTLSLILIIALCLMMLPSAFAEEGGACVVVGADLSEDQINQVYSVFGIARGSVPELKVTNAEERTYLVGLVDESVIGHNSISCVFVRLLPTGAGMDVRTNNITWCTGNMYVSALSTAGISDAQIVVAAPFPVSGTAALTGIYKAYEYMTGRNIAENAKQVSTEELTVTGDLSDLIGSDEATAIIGELKLILDETKNMTDDQLRSTIKDIAREYGVVLDESEMNMIIQLCRKLEKLDVNGIMERVNGIQDTIKKLSETKEKVDGFAGNVSRFFSNVVSFLKKTGSFFEQLFGSRN